MSTPTPPRKRQVIPLDRPASGSDLEALIWVLGAERKDLQWAAGLGSHLWYSTTQQEILRDASLALLVRLLATEPARSLLPQGVDLMPLLDEITSLLPEIPLLRDAGAAKWGNARRRQMVSMLLGRHGSAAWRWLNERVPTRLPGAALRLLQMLARCESREGRLAFLTLLVDVAHIEASARGLDLLTMSSWVAQEDKKPKKAPPSGAPPKTKPKPK